MRKNKSPVWDYFEVTKTSDQGKVVECRTGIRCRANFEIIDGSTTKLRHHLKREHYIFLKMKKKIKKLKENW